MLGISEQAIIGKTVLEIFSPEKAEEFQRQDEEVILTGELMSLEEWLQFPVGPSRLMNTRKTKFCGDDGTFYGLAGITRDVTSQWRIEGGREQFKKNSLPRQIQWKQSVLLQVV